MVYSNLLVMVVTKYGVACGVLWRRVVFLGVVFVLGL